jgi:hypothetical protein
MKTKNLITSFNKFSTEKNLITNFCVQGNEPYMCMWFVLAAWSWVLREEPTGPQQVKKFPEFYDT